MMEVETPKFSSCDDKSTSLLIMMLEVNFWLISVEVGKFAQGGASLLVSVLSILTSKGTLFAKEWPLGCNMALDILNSVKWRDCSISNSLVSTMFKNPVGRVAVHRTLHTWNSLGINFKCSSQVYFCIFLLFKDESGKGDLQLCLQKCFLLAFAPRYFIKMPKE